MVILDNWTEAQVCGYNEILSEPCYCEAFLIIIYELFCVPYLDALTVSTIDYTWGPSRWTQSESSRMYETGTRSPMNIKPRPTVTPTIDGLTLRALHLATTQRI